MNEQIEVPVSGEIPLSKYLARIPKALFVKGRNHCNSRGVSFNTLLTLALRDDLGADDIEVASQPKLSQVLKDELVAMEARLIEALKPPEMAYSLSFEPQIKVDGEPSIHAGGKGEILEKGEKVIMVSTREGASFVPPSSLDWDNPAPQHRLWPDNPPVNSLAPEPLKGQVWVVTGDFDTMTTSRAREILQQTGAIVATTVNKKSSAVLAGYSPESEKLDAAEAQMLPVWGELQFLHMAKFIGADVRIPE